jgi:hypothetical protein
MAAASECTPRPLETLLQHVAQPVDPFFTRPPPGVYTLLVNESDAEMLKKTAQGLAPRQLLPSTGKIAYIPWHNCLKEPLGCTHVEQRWAQRGAGVAVNAGALRGVAYPVGRHSWPGETGIDLSKPLPIDLNFGPIHVCCSDATKFDIKELRETLKFADKMARHYDIWHLIHKNGQMKTDQPCMPIALALSVNPVVVNFWDASVHAHMPLGTQVYLTLRELPGVPVLSATNPAPGVQWKKVGLFAYDDWLHVYSPETDAENADHAALVNAAES